MNTGSRNIRNDEVSANLVKFTRKRKTFVYSIIMTMFPRPFDLYLQYKQPFRCTPSVKFEMKPSLGVGSECLIVIWQARTDIFPVAAFLLQISASPICKWKYRVYVICHTFYYFSNVNLTCKEQNYSNVNAKLHVIFPTGRSWAIQST